MNNTILYTHLNLLSQFLRKDTTYYLEFIDNEWKFTSSDNRVLFLTDLIGRYSMLDKSKKYVLSAYDAEGLVWSIDSFLNKFKNVNQVGITEFESIRVIPTKDGFKLKVYNDRVKQLFLIANFELISTSNRFIIWLSKLLR